MSPHIFNESQTLMKSSGFLIDSSAEFSLLVWACWNSILLVNVCCIYRRPSDFSCSRYLNLIGSLTGCCWKFELGSLSSNFFRSYGNVLSAACFCKVVKILAAFMALNCRFRKCLISVSIGSAGCDMCIVLMGLIKIDIL